MDRVTVVHGDAGQSTDLFGAAALDVILCPNLLECVDDPTLVLRGAGRMLRGNSAILSIVVRNQMGEAFKAAIPDLTAAETSLSTEWESESRDGGRVRLFTSVGLRAMSTSESLESIAQRGVRVVVEYLPPNISRTSQYERMFELEPTLGPEPEFAAIARYTHCLARRRENRR
jgi:2-polyprenyl-3-methyl-5-hydroxy-6-metoxy-1,4-benzoquinol methylase